VSKDKWSKLNERQGGPKGRLFSRSDLNKNTKEVGGKGLLKREVLFGPVLGEGIGSEWCFAKGEIVGETSQKKRKTKKKNTTHKKNKKQKKNKTTKKKKKKKKKEKKNEKRKKKKKNKEKKKKKEKKTKKKKRRLVARSGKATGPLKKGGLSRALGGQST